MDYGRPMKPFFIEIQNFWPGQTNSLAFGIFLVELSAPLNPLGILILSLKNPSQETWINPPQKPSTNPKWISKYLAKLNWGSQQGRLFSLPPQINFPISFKPKIAIAKFVWKMQKKKSGIMKNGWEAMPLFLLDDLLIEAGAHKCINKLFMYLYGRDESLSWIKHLGCRMRRLFWSDEPRSVKIGHTVWGHPHWVNLK